MKIKDQRLRIYFIEYEVWITCHTREFLWTNETAHSHFVNISKGLAKQKEQISKFT